MEEAEEERSRARAADARDAAERRDLEADYMERTARARATYAAAVKDLAPDGDRAKEQAAKLRETLDHLKVKFEELQAQLAERQREQPVREREAEAAREQEERLDDLSWLAELREEVPQRRAAWEKLGAGRLCDRAYVAAVLAGGPTSDPADRQRLIDVLDEWLAHKRGYVEHIDRKAESLRRAWFGQVRACANEPETLAKLEAHKHRIERSIERKVRALGRG